MKNNLSTGFLLSFFLFLTIRLDAQDHLSWTTLADVSWEEVLDEQTGITIIKGTFGEDLKAYDGKEVYISGYIIPLDAMGFSYALSRTSYASCFFCGQAGPETVIDIKIKPRSIPPEKQNNTQLTFKGIIRLKETNELGLNYILENAIEI
jgi:hypothetical protein